jgi:hypothetical protein
MKIGTIQYSLIGILVGSLVLEAFGVIVARNRMWPEEFHSLIFKILGVYSAQIGLVVGGIVGDNRIKAKHAPRGEALTALGLALVWALFVGWRPFSLMFTSQDSVQLVATYLDDFSWGGSFLLAAALTYFFTTRFR